MKYLKTFELYSKEIKNIDDILDKANSRGGISSLSEEELNILKNKGKIDDDLNDDTDSYKTPREFFNKEKARREIKYQSEPINKPNNNNLNKRDRFAQQFMDLKNDVINNPKKYNTINLLLKLKEIKNNTLDIYEVKDINDLPDDIKKYYLYMENVINKIATNNKEN